MSGKAAAIRRLLLACVWAPALLGHALVVAQAPQRVMVPSHDRDASGQAVMLIGHWSPAPMPMEGSSTAPAARGAMLLLHGCGGPYEASGALSARMRSYTALLQQQGWSVLVLDSLTTRGERELCTQRLGTRKVTQANRRLDAWGGLAWLAQQPGVDAQRLGLLGWSHGGSTVLAAIEADRLSRRPDGVPLPAWAVAYYPGCMEVLQGGRRPAVPLLMQLGEADDWTPAQPCVQWANQVNSSRGNRSGPEADLSVAASVEVALYPGAYHGFDGDAPVRLRRDVPNGVNRGQGVHVGADPQARTESLVRLRQWLARFD